MFSQAQFEATIREIQSGMTAFSGNLDKMIPAAAAATDHWYIPDAIADEVMWLARETVKWGKKLIDWFIELLKGVAAPVYMFIDAWQWSDIKGTAVGVSDSLSAQNLVVDDSSWSGKARDAYVAAADAQAQAVSRVGSIADKTMTVMLTSAGAGLAFYLALALVLVKLIAASITALAAFGSAVFSWAGAAIILEEAGVNTAIVVAALAALTTCLGAQVTAMVNLHSEAANPGNFPGGHWPKTNTVTYDDATIKNGGTGWSLKDD
jgi:hypothetical protein